MKFRFGLILILLLPIGLMNPQAEESVGEDRTIIFNAQGKAVGIDLFPDHIEVYDRESNALISTFESFRHIGLNSQFRQTVNLKILQAPGSIVENQVFDGVTLTLEDSPSSIIQNNTFLNIASVNTISAIKVVSSPDTLVQGNVINEVTVENKDFDSRNTYYSSAIEIDTSDNVLVVDNSISNIRASAQPLARTLAVGVRVVFSDLVTIDNNFVANLSSSVAVNRVFGIYLFKSNNSVIIENTMENLFGHNPQFATYVSGIYIETSDNQTISQNTVSNLNSRGTSISTGIRLFNVQQIQITDNDISFVISGQNAFGLYFTRVSTGDVQSNYIENVTSVGGLETTAFTLEDTNFLSIQDNHAVFVDKLISLVGSSGQNLIFNNVLNDNPIGAEEVGPIISPHSNIQYRVDSNDSYFISWVVIDSDPTIFQIFKNGDLFKNGTWQSGVPIIIDVSGLAEGEYNFTLIVYDTQGNNATDTVFVFVTPHNFLSDGVNYIRDFEEGLTFENIINLSPFIIAIYIAIELIRAQFRAQKRKKLLKQRELHETFKEMKNNPGKLIDNIFTHNLEDDN